MQKPEMNNKIFYPFLSILSLLILSLGLACSKHLQSRSSSDPIWKAALVKQNSIILIDSCWMVYPSTGVPPIPPFMFDDKKQIITQPKYTFYYLDTDYLINNLPIELRDIDVRKFMNEGDFYKQKCFSNDHPINMKIQTHYDLVVFGKIHEQVAKNNFKDQTFVWIDLIKDPFSPKGERLGCLSQDGFSYVPFSRGPDGDFDFDEYKIYNYDDYFDMNEMLYDPSNGAFSNGDIVPSGLFNSQQWSYLF